MPAPTETGQTLDLGTPLPFFLHNVLGIHTALGRVPLAVNADGYDWGGHSRRNSQQ